MSYDFNTDFNADFARVPYEGVAAAPVAFVAVALGEVVPGADAGIAAATIKLTAVAVGEIGVVGDGVAPIVFEAAAVGEVELPAGVVSGDGAAVIHFTAVAVGHVATVPKPKPPPIYDSIGWISGPLPRFKVDKRPVVGIGRGMLWLVAHAEGSHYTEVTGRCKGEVQVVAQATGEFFDAVGEDNNFVLFSVAA